MVEDLTPRGRRFLDSWGRRAPRGVVDASTELPAELRGVMVSHERRFGGLSFPILGGELEGWIRLGMKTGKARLSSSGAWMFNFAEPQFVQCGLVCREDGHFGVSWSGEFLPWHADVRHLIEASAVWADLIGWQRPALCEGTPQDVPAVLAALADLAAVGELSPEGPASSELTSWWLGDGVAVYSEPYITYLPEGARRIHVITAAAREGLRIREALQEAEKSATGGLRVRSVDEYVGDPTDYPFV
ncbi:hypothetical protein [Streptomyces sp. NPDC050121]|uniref:hypothetical protein n=1 Tax=Streptomyces sp. NPDC050121 TaxID=3365601 RepID=UPI0037A114B5